jgi:protein phosphatase 2C family protein 2/3
LPFTKDIVGTYSCHGMEPIYNDNEPWSEEEEEGAVVSPPKKQQQQQQQEEEEEPTLVAKINQDRGGIAYPYANCKKTALFCVYDGHGQGGELVSQYALTEIQRRLEQHPQFPAKVAFEEAFAKVDQAIMDEPTIESYYAGTTACVALLQDTKLTLAHVGDSRAVLARLTDGNYTAVPLTEDHNPDVPLEHERITASGGFVTGPPGPGLSARVWLDEPCSEIGLAMSRSLGDHAVAEIGVIAVPSISTFTVTPKDEFLILASDGVWEFLSSQQAVTIVAKHINEGSTKACQALIEAAALQWHEEEGEYRDDITAIVVRLKMLWNK